MSEKLKTSTDNLSSQTQSKGLLLDSSQPIKKEKIRLQNDYNKEKQIHKESTRQSLKEIIIEKFKQKEIEIQNKLMQLVQDSKLEISTLRQKHFKNVMVIHEPTADINKIQRRVLSQKYEIEKAFAKEYIKTTIFLSDNPKSLKTEKQAYWNIDYSKWNWNKENPNVEDILRDDFWEKFHDNMNKIWEDFEKDPLVWVFDITKIIWAWTVAWAATILSWWNPIVWWFAFTASDNAIWYVWHWFIWATRWENFIEAWNKAIWLYQLDEEWNILRKNWKPVFKKWEVIAVEKFWEVAMGILLMWPISKVWWNVAKNVAMKWHNNVISKWIWLWAEAFTFSSVNVGFNPIISWVSTVADTRDLNKWKLAFESTINESLSPANFLSSYIHNVAFIWALRTWNKLWWEFVAKKFQSKAIESRYNSLTNKYEAWMSELNSEMKKLWFWVIREWKWYKLVDWNWNPLETVPESIQAKQLELNKIMAELALLSIATAWVNKENQLELEKEKLTQKLETLKEELSKLKIEDQENVQNLMKKWKEWSLIKEKFTELRTEFTEKLNNLNLLVAQTKTEIRRIEITELNSKIIKDDKIKQVDELDLENQLEKYIWENIQEWWSNASWVYELKGNPWLILIEKSAWSFPHIWDLAYYYSKLWNNPNIPRVLKVFEKWWKTFSVMEKATWVQLDKMSINEIENIPQEHYNKFIETLKKLNSVWLCIDPSKSSNFFYDSNKWFIFIDLNVWSNNQNYIKSNFIASILGGINITPIIEMKIDRATEWSFE